jgi:hypothetical protein
MMISEVPRLRVLVAERRQVSGVLIVVFARVWWRILGDVNVTIKLGWLTLIGTFLELAVMRGLLHNGEDLLRESLIGDGPGERWIIGHFVVVIVQGY